MVLQENIVAGETVNSYLVNNPRFPFCKGCGHTTVVRKLNEALVALQIPPHDVALITDIGCIGLADSLFKEIHTVHTTHGRSTAFAAGIALADSVLAEGKLKPIVLIGDGGAIIGLQHLVHAAMLNVDLTVLICNNFVYGMTGGQGSGLTPESFITATTPHGNIVAPADLCGILKSSNAPFVARTLATDRNLSRLIRDAIAFSGFAAIEILELCTEYAVPKNNLTGKLLSEIAERNNWKLGVVVERTDRQVFVDRYRQNARDSGSVELAEEKLDVQTKEAPWFQEPLSILIAGSAGERVQSAAAVFLQAAIRSGLNVTQENDNPVTQGSGFSLSELWLSPSEIGYTGIETPDYILVTSDEGLRELKLRGLLAQHSAKTFVYVDASLSDVVSGPNVYPLPFRSTMGADNAAILSLAFVALKHKFLNPGLLEGVLKENLGNRGEEIFNRTKQLGSFVDSKVAS